MTDQVMSRSNSQHSEDRQDTSKIFPLRSPAACEDGRIGALSGHVGNQDPTSKRPVSEKSTGKNLVSRKLVNKEPVDTRRIRQSPMHRNAPVDPTAPTSYQTKGNRYDAQQQAKPQKQQTSEPSYGGAKPGLKHVMIISEQAELAETIQAELSQAGYQVSVIHDGLRGLLAANRMNPDVVITCWKPPRISGLEICERLRASRRRGSIVLITPEDITEQRVSGFDAGADDCVSLPLQKREFVARVRAQLSKTYEEQSPEPMLYCADLLLNRETREVFRKGHFVRLTAKEFDLMEYLMAHYFQVVTRAQILENVWGYDYTGSSNIVEVYIRYLRTKLEAVEDKRVIHTVRSVGYILRDG